MITASLIAGTRAYREALAAAFRVDGRVELIGSSTYSDDAVMSARDLSVDGVLFQLPLAQGLAVARALTTGPDRSVTKLVVFGVGDRGDYASAAQKIKQGEKFAGDRRSRPGKDTI